MKRYRQIPTKIFGALLSKKRKPTLRMLRSKPAGFVIAILSLIFVATGSMIVNAAVNTSKTGRDTTTSSTTQTQPGHTVRWVMNYGHSGSLGTMTLTDPIPAGTQYVPDSFVAPPGYSKSFSTNSGTSYGSTDTGTATTNLKAEGEAPATQTAVSSGLAAPPAAFNGAQGGGDGYEAWFTETELWNFNHHTTNAGLDDRNIQCHDKSTGASCSGFPTYVNSVSGTPLGTGTSDIGFPQVPTGGQYLTSTENKVFLPSHHTSGTAHGTIDSNGIICVDLVAKASCGYTALFNSTEADMAGGVAIDNKFYSMAKDGQVYCVDMPANTVCAGYPKQSYAGVTPDAFSAAPDSGKMFHLESFDGVHIFTQMTNNNDGSGNYPHLIGCLDITTGNICSGWNPSKTYNSTSSYEAILSPIKNASGSQTEEYVGLPRHLPGLVATTWRRSRCSYDRRTSRAIVVCS